MGSGPHIQLNEGGIQWPFVLSVLLHALVFGLLLVRVSGRTGEVPAALEPLRTDQPAETWAGTTAELPAGERLYEVSLNELGAGSPAPESAPKAVPAEPPKAAPKEPPPPKMPEKSAPEKTEPQRPAAPAKAKAAPKAPVKPEDDDDPYGDVASAAPEEAKPAASAKSAAAPVSSGTSDAAAGAGTAGLGGADTSGGHFGAVGVPGARDLGRAFNQAIPAACAADPVWSELPMGAVGTIRVILEIGADGRLLSWKAVEENPPKALQNMAKRTYAMLSGGMFTLRPGGLSAGRQTVQVSAEVGMSDKAPAEGGQIELSQHYENGVGRSSFIQPSRREVSFQVKVLKVEVLETLP